MFKQWERWRFHQSHLPGTLVEVRVRNQYIWTISSYGGLRSTRDKFVRRVSLLETPEIKRVSITWGFLPLLPPPPRPSSRPILGSQTLNGSRKKTRLPNDPVRGYRRGRTWREGPFFLGTSKDVPWNPRTPPFPGKSEGLRNNEINRQTTGLSEKLRAGRSRTLYAPYSRTACSQSIW